MKLRGGDDSPEGKQKRLDSARRTGVAAANRFGGKPVGDRVRQPVLGAIKFRYGLSVLEPVPQGRNWAVYGEIQRAVAPTSAVVPDGSTPASPTTVDPNDPGTPAPGIGRIGSHGSKPSSQRKGPKIHHMESEHIIPFGVGKRLWQMVNLAMPGRGGREDRTQTTIMIYEGAADAKTNAERRGPAGSPEAPTPGPDQVTDAATRQYDDVVGLLNTVLDDVNEGRAPGITPSRRRRRT